MVAPKSIWGKFAIIYSPAIVVMILLVVVKLSESISSADQPAAVEQAYKQVRQDVQKLCDDISASLKDEAESIQDIDKALAEIKKIEGEYTQAKEKMSADSALEALAVRYNKAHVDLALASGLYELGIGNLYDRVPGVVKAMEVPAFQSLYEKDRSGVWQKLPAMIDALYAPALRANKRLSGFIAASDQQLKEENLDENKASRQQIEDAVNRASLRILEYRCDNSLSTKSK